METVKRAVVSLKSDDLEIFQLKQIMAQDETFVPADFYDETVTRGFQDIEWLMFIMVPIIQTTSSKTIVNMV